MSPKTVFQIRKCSGWDDINVKDIKRGQEFRVLVDDAPLIQETGSQIFVAEFNAFMDDEGEWRVAVS